MIKTVQIYTNRISTNLSPLLAYAYQYNLKHGITLHFDITPVNVTGYQSSLVRNMSGNYVWALAGADALVPQNDHDITVFLFDQSEWKTPWWNPFPLRSDTPTGSCVLSNNKPFINLPYYASRAADSNVMLIHELMHAFRMLAGCTDVMDTYIDNANPDSSTGNFSQQWKLLANWLNPMTNTTPAATITRMYGPKETTGSLLAMASDGATFQCKTLELPNLGNQHDISCIPEGSYQCSLQPFHNTVMYELASVPNRTAVFLHNGNFTIDSLGCILLGKTLADINNDKILDVTTSVETVNQFKLFMGNRPFKLIIKS